MYSFICADAGRLNYFLCNNARVDAIQMCSERRPLRHEFAPTHAEVSSATCPTAHVRFVSFSVTQSRQAIWCYRGQPPSPTVQDTHTEGFTSPFPPAPPPPHSNTAGVSVGMPMSLPTWPCRPRRRDQHTRGNYTLWWTPPCYFNLPL